MPLEPTFRLGSVEVVVSPGLEPPLDWSMLVLPICTLLLVMEPRLPFQQATIFRVRSGEDYDLHFYTTEDGKFCLWRNGLQCYVGTTGGYGIVVLALVWTPTSLLLSVTGEAGKTMTAGPLFTPPVGLPSFLPRWLRENALLPKVTYGDTPELLAELVILLEHLGEKIRKTAATEGFWDDQYEGQTIVDRLPKPEPKLTKLIELHLAEIEFSKGIQVYPQADAGPGRMDFLFVAQLHDGSTAKVCAEFKLQHSPDLLSGIEKQLVAYMNNKDTTTGLFVALDFGPKYPMRAKPDRRHLDPSPEWQDPRIVLADYAARLLPQYNVRSVVLPMYKPTNPSAL